MFTTNKRSWTLLLDKVARLYTFILSLKLQNYNFIYIESLGECKSTLNKDYMRIIS